jgi:hypothetical protein
MEAAKARRKTNLNTNKKAGREHLALSQLQDILDISYLRLIADEQSLQLLFNAAATFFQRCRQSASQFSFLCTVKLFQQ